MVMCRCRASLTVIMCRLCRDRGVTWCTCSAGSVFAVIYRVSTIIFVVLLVGGLLDAGCVGMYAW